MRRAFRYVEVGVRTADERGGGCGIGSDPGWLTKYSVISNAR